MFKNYLIVTIRHLLRYKLYSIVNIVGLSLGLATLIFSQLLANYEESHDQFWPNADRIYGVYTNVKPGSGFGLKTMSATWSAVGPLVQEGTPGVEVRARSMGRSYLARHGERKFEQPIRFVDPGFLDIFTLDFVAGDPRSALADPSGLIITESTARKYFGDGNAMGEIITFNVEYDLRVTAIIRDIPINSHFKGLVIENSAFEMIATYQAFARIADEVMEGSWDSLNSSDKLYLLFAPGTSRENVNRQLTGIFERNAPEDTREQLSGIEARPIADLNLFLWQATGIPAIGSLQILGILILALAGLNYTNLATAQVMGRTREVGLRRTMGATRAQLFAQFLVESIALTAIALVLATTLVDLAIPFVNSATNKVIGFHYLTNIGTFGWLVLIALLVGGLAGGYPAFLIARSNTVSILNGQIHRGKGGARIRSAMLVVQFTISVFMMIAVAIIYSQNQKTLESGDRFAKDEIIVLQRMARPEIQEVVETMRNEMLRIPGVETFALSSQVPFEQNHSNPAYSRIAGDEAGEVDIYRISIDADFMRTYDMPIIAGRATSADIPLDIMAIDELGNPEQGTPVNVIINEMAAKALGWDNPTDAIGGVFYRTVEDDRNQIEYYQVEHRVVGLTPDLNFHGFFNSLKPIIFVNRPNINRLASLRVSRENLPATLAAIDATWNRLAPEYPILRQFLADIFDDIYSIFRGINAALAGFAALALVIASIGLFGLAAFMAERRTKEIGIRKIMGGSVSAIVQLLVWQFSRPVAIAIMLASPLGYLGAKAYLDFFADRATLTPTMFLITALLAFGTAALTVSFHAVRAARANPINALRYE